MLKSASNSRMNGPSEHEALLSLALPSSSADRPSKSRRLTSLPSVAPSARPSGTTSSTTSGSGLFPDESDPTPIPPPLPTVYKPRVLVQISHTTSDQNVKSVY